MAKWDLRRVGDLYHITDEEGVVVAVISQASEQTATLMARAAGLHAAAWSAVEWFDEQFAEHDEDSRDGLSRLSDAGDIAGELQEAAEAAEAAGTEVTASELADKFSGVLRSWLTPGQLDDINHRNAGPGYAHGACATGDFCDSNQAMINALESLGVPFTLDASLINEAWRIARESGFQPRKVEAN